MAQHRKSVKVGNVEVKDAFEELKEANKKIAALQRQLQQTSIKRQRVLQQGGPGWVQFLVDLDMAFDRAMRGLVDGLHELEAVRRRINK